MNTPKSHLRSTSLQWIIKQENVQTDSRKNNDWRLKIHLNTSLRRTDHSQMSIPSIDSSNIVQW